MSQFANCGQYVRYRLLKRLHAATDQYRSYCAVKTVTARDVGAAQVMGRSGITGALQSNYCLFALSFSSLYICGVRQGEVKHLPTLGGLSTRGWRTVFGNPKS